VEVKAPIDPPKLGGGSGAVKSDSVVKVAATADNRQRNGTQIVTITMDITPPWHAYANPIDNDMLDGSKTVRDGGRQRQAENLKIDYRRASKSRTKSSAITRLRRKIANKATIQREKDDAKAFRYYGEVHGVRRRQRRKTGAVSAAATVTVPVPGDARAFGLPLNGLL